MPVDGTSPNHGGARTHTLGVVVHSTRSGVIGQSLDQEFRSTVNWFYTSQGDRAVSANAVVGPGLLARPVPADITSWHARWYNGTHLGIELTQIAPRDPINEEVFRLAAWQVAQWWQVYRFPLAWNSTAGLCEHLEIPPGIQDGKTDIGPPFDRDRFLATVLGYIHGAGG